MYQGADIQADENGEASDLIRIRDLASPISSAEVRRLLRNRRKRASYFPDGLFADPSWDMLLHLYASELAGRRTTVVEVCTAGDVPETTALRWLSVLVKQDLCTKSQDPFDGRRRFVSLSETGRAALDNYFQSVRT